jgi:hypothetical protein
MSESKELTLETVAGGVAPPLWRLELEKVLANIDDPNTDPDAVREITMVVKFKPRAGTDEVATSLQVTSKLASRKPVAGTIYMGMRDGKPVAVAYDPKQRSIFADEQDEAVLPMIRKEAAQ